MVRLGMSVAAPQDVNSALSDVISQFLKFKEKIIQSGHFWSKLIYKSMLFLPIHLSITWKYLKFMMCTQRLLSTGCI